MPPDRNFWNVKFAPLRFAAAWLVYLSMRGIVLLPFRWQLAIGKRAGTVSRWLLPSRRMVVRRNLEVCFPAASDADRAALMRAHFQAMGASVVEMAMGWFGPLETIRRRVRIDGAEHLERALAQGRGVILLAGHFSSFEFFFPVLAPLCGRLCGMYKSQRNPIMNKMMNIGRGRSFDHLILKESVRDMLRELAANSVVWYASDQKYVGKGSILLPFFGEPAMTNTAISRIARISGAAVLPYFAYRLPGDDEYELVISPPLTDFPSANATHDTMRLVAVLEDQVRRCPEQYWWIHKRFKGRPQPCPDIYGVPARAPRRAGEP